MEPNPSSQDFISKLPDDLLCHVLSFLSSTKEAASTSFLSKRWSILLPFLPHLVFNDSELRNTEMRLQQDFEGFSRGLQQIGVFKDFVDRLLSLRIKNSSSVKKVSLKCRHVGIERDSIIRWIRTSNDLGVRQLALHLNYNITNLPFSVFTSKELVNLMIGTRVCLFRSPSDNVSPMVESLLLDSVAFGDVKLGFEPILTALPSLLNLWVHESKGWYYWNGTISSVTLERLVYRSDGNSSVPKHCVSFDTPSLVYLDYSDIIADRYGNLHLDSLVEAKLDLVLTPKHIVCKNPPDDLAFFSWSCYYFVHGNQKCQDPLLICGRYITGEEIPVFNNLIYLSMGCSTRTPFVFWKLLPSLLHNSINLKTLIVKGLVHYVREGWEDNCRRVSLSCDDMCDSLSSCAIKVLEINGYRGTSQELINEVKLFMGKLSHLEIVRVAYEGVDDGERSRFMLDLLLLPKASSKCEFQVEKETA